MATSDNPLLEAFTNPDMDQSVNVPTFQPERVEPSSTPLVNLQEAAQRNKRNLQNALVDKLGVANVPLIGPLLEFDVNAAASVWSGAARWASNIATSPIDAITNLAQGTIPDKVLEAYNRQKQGSALPDDQALLQGDAGAVDGISQSFANRLQSIDKLRQASKSVADTMDISGIVNTDNRDALSDGLKIATARDVKQIRTGVDLWKQGEYGDAVKNIAAGIGKTAVSASIEAAGHPLGVAEYVGENIPQLAMGAVLPGTLGLSNIGYGLNEQRDGITDYQAEHQGAMPNPDEMRSIALNSAAAALAENVGDHASLNALFKAGKGGVTKALKEIGEASLKEGATEGAQTYFENNAHLKDTSIEEVVESAAIGAAVGGIFGGAGAVGNREGSEAAPKVNTAVDQAFTTAVQTGDVSALADPESKTYAPDRAVQALRATALSDTATPETKAAAVQKADEIQTNLQEQIQQYQELKDNASPEGIAQITAERDRVAQMAQQAATPDEAEQHQQTVAVYDGIIKDAQSFDHEANDAKIAGYQAQLEGVQSGISQLRTVAAPKGEELDQVVEQASVPADQATPDTEVATNKVLTLTMENPDGFTKEHIDSLVADTNNSLTPDQRTALSSFSAAQEATESFKTIHGVNSDIIAGGNGFRGIPQFREAVRTALADGNVEQAQQTVSELASFAQSRQSKADVITAAYDQVKGTQDRLYVAPDAAGNWSQVPTETKGGQYVDARSFKLRDQVIAEADVLTKTATSFGAFIKANASVAPVVSQRVAPAAVAEPVAAPEVQEETQAAPFEDGKVAVIRDTPKVTKDGVPAAEYTSGNMLGKFFDQAVSKGKTATTRPLVATKNFLSQLASNPKVADEHLAKPMEPKQESAVQTYVNFSKAAYRQIEAAFPQPKKQGYAFQQYAGSLRNEDGSIDQNVVAAVSYAMFNYLADQSTPFNTDKTINAIIGRDSDDFVSPPLRNVFGRGENHNFVASSLGKDIAEALGLKAVNGAPTNEQIRLELSLGEVAVQAMTNMGVTEKVSVKVADINTAYIAAGIDPIKLTNDRQTYNYIRAKWDRSDEGKWTPHPYIQKVRESSKGSQAVLNKMFGAEQSAKEPSLEPVEFSAQYSKRTDQEIPSAQVASLKDVAKRGYQVIPSMWNLVEKLSTDAMHRMNGVDPDAIVHSRNLLSTEAKQNQLANEIDSSVNWVRDTLLQEGRDLETPFYLMPESWSNQRSGFTQNVMDPQTNKFVRFFIQQADWDTNYDINDKDQMDSFKLRVLESFGVKTEANTIAAVLDDPKKGFNAWVSKPEIAQAVKELIKIQNEQPFDESALVAGVLVGGEKFHSLAALQALAQYELAKQGNGKFTSSLIGEGDGINNGPTLAMIWFGASNKALMDKGAIFTDGEFTSFGEYKGQAGAHDVYQGIMSAILKAISAANAPLITAIETILGPLSNSSGGIESAGRNIVKTPLTALVFGSNYDRAASAMAETFVDNLYEKIEKAVAKGEDLKPLIQAINLLIANDKYVPKLDENTSAETLLTTELTPKQENAIKSAFAVAIGEAAKTALEAQFGEFVKRRNVFNRTSNSGHAIYDIAYKVMREQVLKDAPRSNGADPQVLHDLTRQQAAQIADKLKAVAPIINSYLSQKSNQPAAGMFMGKRTSELSTQTAYSVQNTMGNKANVVNNQSQVIGQTSTSVLWGSPNYMGNPGVATASRTVHSGDSAIATVGYTKHNMLNVHDALAGPDWQLASAMQTMNATTYDALVNYSPMYEMQRSYENTLVGFAEMLKDPEFAAAAQPMLKKAFPKDGPDTVLKTISDEAKLADAQKYGLLKGVSHVAQYSSNDGTHVVTDEDKAMLAAKAAELSGRGNKDAIKAAAVIRKLANTAVAPVAAAPKPTVETQWGTLGKPVIESDPSLVSALEGNRNMTGHQLADLVRSLPGASEYMKNLMGAVKKVTKQSLKVIYITSKSKADAAIGTGVEKSRGWYAADSTTEGVFIKSPEFIESGVTPELLAHELVHAALAQTIQREQGKNTDAGKLIAELEDLRQQAAKATDGQSKFSKTTADVQEFVAWGMTNQDFQQEVLAKLQVKSSQGGNALVKGIRKFIDLLTGLLFGKQAEGKNTGMGLMIQNVSGLFNAASQAKAETSTITQMYEDAVDAVKTMTTEETYDALAANNTGLPTAEGHDLHLRALINGPINKLFGPMGGLKDRFVDNQTITNDDVFLKALDTGKLPFASNALGANIVLNVQEAFVTEQVEATVAAALEVDNNQIVRGALQSVYSEARTQLRGKIAQDKYDYLFSSGTAQNGKSDHLSRFAALGLGSQEIHAALGFNTQDATVPLNNLSLAGRLVELFRRLVTRIVSLHDKTTPGEQANSRLSNLVDRLVDIEGRHKEKLAQAAVSRVNAWEDAFDGLGKKATNAANALADSTLFTATDNTILKTLRSVITVVANDRAGMVMDAVQKMRNVRYPNTQEGILAGSITELRGDTDGNAVADGLHKLAKEAERIRQKTQEGITQHVIESFDGKGEYLTPEMRTSVSKSLLRTDAQALFTHLGMADTFAAMKDPAVMSKVQKDLETQIKALPNGRGMVALAKNLAHMMVDGRNTSAATVMNTYNIANMIGQSKKAKPVTKENAQTAQTLLDPLVSAYAVQYEREANPESHKRAMDVFTREQTRGNESGVEMILRTHKRLQDDSAQTLFADTPTSRIQGYLPEIHDSKIEVFAVAESDADAYLRQGYRVVGPVQEDPNSPHPTARVMITRRSSGSDSMLSGAFNTTSNGRRGTNLRESTVSLNSDMTYQLDPVLRDKLTRNRQPDLDAILTASDSYDPRKQKMGHAVAAFDGQGKVMDYRYMMGQTARDALLMRDNNMDTLLGRFAAQNVDKAEVNPQNYNVIGAMFDDYQDNFSKDPNAYITVGLDSKEPDMQELYRLLPLQARKDIKRIWGDNNMYIRADQLNLIMGYRKLSLTQAFDKEARTSLKNSSPYVRSVTEQMFVGMAEAVMGEKAKWQVGKAEDVIQEVNAWIKDTLVVRNISTLVGNLKSNLSIALIQGVPLKDIAQAHAIGLKAALDYRKDSKREIQLQNALDIGYVPQGQAEIDNELMVIRDRLARNPIKPLVDAGLMPTIAEDIEANDSPYGYKGRAAAWIDSKTGKVPGSLKTVARNVLMTHDTQVYKFLSQTTQLSDLISRYVVYQHVTTRARNPLSRVEALKQIENDFINYDRPSHKMVEYLNSVGVFRFTKYTMRIQKTLARLLREKPFRALSAIMLGHALPGMNQVFEGSWINHINNPLHPPGLDTLGAFGELPAMQLIP